MIEKEAVGKLTLNQLHFLDRCAAFEHKCAQLYYYFESLFEGDAELAALWKKTAREEENHAKQFELAVRLQGTGMTEVRTDVSRGMDKLLELEKIVEKIMTVKHSGVEALALAIKLEEQMAKVHMSSIVVFGDRDLKNLFDAMMQSDVQHVSMLEDFLQARTV